MSAFEISTRRATQVQEICATFLSHFIKAIGTEISKEEFLSLYAPDVEWYDHAFQIHRVGHTAVLGLQEAWLHCNKDFRSTVKAIRVTHDGGVLEQVWTGVCANDIVRPDGEVAMKASGKRYTCHVVMVMRISDAGLIERIDEYYNKSWDDGRHESEYAVIRGSSMRAKA